MVPGHRAPLGILFLRPQSFCCEWAHANGSGPNASPNDPHITHVGDFPLQPQGRFQGRRPTQTWGKWCRGLQITARRGCRGDLLRLCLLRFLRVNKHQVREILRFHHMWGCAEFFPAPRGKKSASPAHYLHDGSTSHPSAKHCPAFAGPYATCGTFGSHGSSPVQFAGIFVGDHPARIRKPPSCPRHPAT